jgi:hypothetical protein
MRVETNDSPCGENFLKTARGFVAIIHRLKDLCCSCACIHDIIFPQIEFARRDCAVDFEDSVVRFILV